MKEQFVEEAIANGEIIGFYTNTHNTRKFVVGYPLICLDNFCYVQLIDTKAVDDGFALINLETVYMFEMASNYLNKISKQRVDIEKHKPLRIQFSSLKELFSILKENSEIVSIRFKGHQKSTKFYIKDVADGLLSVCKSGTNLKIMNIEDACVYVWGSKDERKD